MTRVRTAIRIAGLLLLFAVCAPLHIITKSFLRRSPWPPRFLAAAGWIVGARVRVLGGPLEPHSLLISNHVSWLDILVLGGSTGCAFVSKENLGHGLVHWLADQNHTVYVRREHRKAARNQAIAIAAALEREQPVALFPEGTVGPGDELLPFRSTLIEAVNFAPKDIEIRPVAIDYGPDATEISWHGQRGKDNVLYILGRAGAIPVTIHILGPLDRSGDRKALARQAREAITETLASSGGPAVLYARLQ